MKKITLVPFLFLVGCTGNSMRNLHSQVFPGFETVEMATPKAYKSLEVSGWYSGIPDANHLKVTTGSVQQVRDTAKDFLTGNVDSITIKTSGLINNYYLPQSMFGGSVGWNFSRYFGLGLSGSFASGYKTPVVSGYSLIGSNYKCGIYLRFGGPLGEAEKWSIVGRFNTGISTSSTVVTNDSGKIVEYGLNDSNMNSEAIGVNSTISAAVQYRPIPKVGVSLGFSGTHPLGSFIDSEPKQIGNSMVYTGISIMPIKSVAISPWIGCGFISDSNFTVTGVKLEFTPCFE